MFTKEKKTLASFIHVPKVTKVLETIDLYTQAKAECQEKITYIDDMRKLLKAIFNEQAELKKTCHAFLLKLAELHPINSVDPVTQETIPISKRVCVSTGHQFHIHHLLAFFKVKGKQINPFTNQPFCSDDFEHIQLVGNGKNILHAKPYELSIFASCRKMLEASSESALRLGAVIF